MKIEKLRTKKSIEEQLSNEIYSLEYKTNDEILQASSLLTLFQICGILVDIRDILNAD